MKKNKQNLEILQTLFITMLIISNIISSKVITLNFSFFNFLLPAGIICYPITFLITDIIGEIWGKEEANKVVKYGLIMQFVAMVMVLIGNKLPYLDANMQNAYETLLGQNVIFVIACFASYSLGQFIDVTIFHFIRNKWISKNKNQKLEKGKWLWNNGSTIISQLFDTVVYITIAFGIGSNLLFNDINSLFTMIISQYTVKFIIALLDTPVFYLLTKGSKANNE